ncbi:MAG: DUF4423 domain-containing protein, partial [Bdellovibrionota bacterium]
MDSRPEISQIREVGSLSEFIKKRFSVFKKLISPDEFRQKVVETGIGSRVSFRSIANGKRRFPKSKIPFLARALDMSFEETKKAYELEENPVLDSGGTLKPDFKFVVGPAAILSDPLHTIVLNFCGLGQRLDHAGIVDALSSVGDAETISRSIRLLISEGLIELESDRSLRRLAEGQLLSAPPGLKLDFAKAYIKSSLELAERGYDLPLDSREFAAFTARINREDFRKLKDLVREFRQAVYALTPATDSDSVVQVNINAILVGTADSV